MSPFPHLQCCRVLPFCHEELLTAVSCLQMTQQKMFFTWNPRAMPNRMMYIDDVRGMPTPPAGGPSHAPNSPFNVLDEDEWPPLPTQAHATNVAAAGGVAMHMPGGPPVDDGAIEEPDFYTPLVAPAEGGTGQDHAVPHPPPLTWATVADMDYCKILFICRFGSLLIGPNSSGDHRRVRRIY